MPSTLRTRCALAAAIATVTLAPLSVTRAQHGGRSGGPTIPQVARTAGQFATLLAAVDAAGLTETLLGRGPFTLFAPTDDAFRRLPAGTVDDLLKPENREKLRTILTYHVVGGRVAAAQARTLTSAATVAGPRVQISEQNGELRINDATVRIADVPASNGVVHVIDRVLLPPATMSRASGATGTTRTALDVVDTAIDRGVPLFNDGQPAATAAIYEVAATGLLALGDVVPADARRSLRDALRVHSTVSATDRAWTLRRALDEARRGVAAR
ncbi:MAG: fasciclin domain-containing protein [Gemmatimonadaceae bacterium]|jgi:uncharacterized surface protein with fasciclin (FAS1) repeats|nr:fasciclin domain-containing protein [Gemmatimonadaceae bacterium]